MYLIALNNQRPYSQQTAYILTVNQPRVNSGKNSIAKAFFGKILNTKRKLNNFLIHEYSNQLLMTWVTKYALKA